MGTNEHNFQDVQFGVFKRRLQVWQQYQLTIAVLWTFPKVSQQHTIISTHLAPKSVCLGIDQFSLGLAQVTQLPPGFSFPSWDWQVSLGRSFSWWWQEQNSENSQVLSKSLLVSGLPTSHRPKQVIWPEPRCMEVCPALQSYMVKSTDVERDKECNAIYQVGQRDLKIYTWLMMKKGNKSMKNEVPHLKKIINGRLPAMFRT